MDSSTISSILIWVIPVILGITLHEAAHGYVARMFGDSTAWNLGRVTLNPFKHIDPVGTLLVPGGIILANIALNHMSSDGQASVNFPPFGWAKPVPVDFGRLRSPKRDMLWVAAAGPASNLIQAIIWGFVMSFAHQTLQNDFVYFVGLAGVMVNLSLMTLNLIPLPPFDGGRIMVSLLPMSYAIKLARIEPYGFVILIALLYTGVLDKVLGPIIYIFRTLIFTLTGA